MILKLDHKEYFLFKGAGGSIDLKISKSTQEDEVGGSNERCPLTSNYDAKTSRSETERAFDCHILAPVAQLLN